ncbi:MAG: hydroxymethylpyrimidine/phosphomethylpyrimidine kinase [Bacteroidaceae bacterium]|nr:hydroxymethylpyrimidine/phosphomethylpyrimidine kinase [Bacteroidaceae bacterium]
MEKERENTGKVFLIAGSEPLGSAGVQADIKAITRCGGWAAAALTCIVDEDTSRIKGVYPLSPDLIASQAESFLSSVGADCIKTGVLPTKEIIEAVAGVLRRYARVPKLIDPVIVNFAGEQLVSDAAIMAYKQQLFPLATLITPNRREAEVLLGRPLGDVGESLRELSQWGCSVLVKSVEEGKYLVDYLYEADTQTLTPFPKKKLILTDRNGTGDTLASAIATHLALGSDMQTAVARAEAYMHYFLAGPRYVISADLRK